MSRSDSPWVQALIYLDFHATTPLDAPVLEAMLPFFAERFANPSSAHAAGVEASEAVERAREEVAAVVGAQRRDVVFLSGATEANNLALRGLAGGATTRRRIVSTTIEHPAVLETLHELSREGFDIELLGVDVDGQLDLDELRATVGPDTLVVSVAAANHEIGSLAPLADIAAIAHAHGALFHTDAAQAAGQIPLDLEAAQIDLMSLSAHKLYGPKGVGALIATAGAQHFLRPQVQGGGQERGLRSGTLNVPGIIGFGTAARLAREGVDHEGPRLARLRDLLRDRLLRGLHGVEDNGGPRRLPGNLNLFVPGVDAQALVARCSGVAFSAGSACSSMTSAPSPVLLALGHGELRAEESIRLCVGRPTTEADVERAASLLIAAAAPLQASHGPHLLAEGVA